MSRKRRVTVLSSRVIALVIARTPDNPCSTRDRRQIYHSNKTIHPWRTEFSNFAQDFSEMAAIWLIHSHQDVGEYLHNSRRVTGPWKCVRNDVRTS